MRHLLALLLVLVLAAVTTIAPSTPVRADDGCGGSREGWTLACKGERADGLFSDTAPDHAGLAIRNLTEGLSSDKVVIQFLLDVSGLSRGYSQMVAVGTDGLGVDCFGVCLSLGSQGDLLFADGEARYLLSGTGSASFSVRPTGAAVLADMLLIAAAAIVPGAGCGRLVSPPILVKLAQRIAIGVAPVANDLARALHAGDRGAMLDALRDLVGTILGSAVLFAIDVGADQLAACLAEAALSAASVALLTIHVLLAIGPSWARSSPTARASPQAALRRPC